MTNSNGFEDGTNVVYEKKFYSGTTFTVKGETITAPHTVLYPDWSLVSAQEVKSVNRPSSKRKKEDTVDRLEKLKKTNNKAYAVASFIGAYGPTQIRITDSVFLSYMGGKFPELLDDGKANSSFTAVLSLVLQPMGVVEKCAGGFKLVGSIESVGFLNGTTVLDDIQKSEPTLLGALEDYLTNAKKFPNIKKEDWGKYTTADSLYSPQVAAAYREISHISIERWMTNMLGLDSCNSIAATLLETRVVNIARLYGHIDTVVDGGALKYTLLCDPSMVPPEVAALDGKFAVAPYSSDLDVMKVVAEGIEVRLRLLAFFKKNYGWEPRKTKVVSH
jgi:hypothetical protein